jgi:hypothetical protein
VDVLGRHLPGRPGGAKPGGRALARALGSFAAQKFVVRLPSFWGWFLCGLVLGDFPGVSAGMGFDHFRDVGLSR